MYEEGEIEHDVWSLSPNGHYRISCYPTGSSYWHSTYPRHRAEILPRRVTSTQKCCLVFGGGPSRRDMAKICYFVSMMIVRFQFVGGLSQISHGVVASYRQETNSIPSSQPPCFQLSTFCPQVATGQSLSSSSFPSPTLETPPLSLPLPTEIVSTQRNA
jgi:hypothetical protein